jgi:hypothetical protein
VKPVDGPVPTFQTAEALLEHPEPFEDETLVAEMVLTLPAMGGPLELRIEMRLLAGEWQARVKLGAGEWTDWRHAEVAVGAAPT